MKKLELVCPAGTPAALRVAVDAGADAVYMGLNEPAGAGEARYWQKWPPDGKV